MVDRQGAPSEDIPPPPERNHSEPVLIACNGPVVFGTSSARLKHPRCLQDASISPYYPEAPACCQRNGTTDVGQSRLIRPKDVGGEGHHEKAGEEELGVPVSAFYQNQEHSRTAEQIEEEIGDLIGTVNDSL
jgi:hypothetical protein